MRAFAKTDSPEFDLLMAATVLPLLAFDIVVAALVHIDAKGELLNVISVSIGSFGLWILVAAYCYCRWRGIARMADVSQLLAWSMLVVPAISFLIPVAGRTPYPLIDASLARIDAVLQFHTVSVVHWVSQFPVLRRTLAISYNLLGLMILAALVVPGLCGRGGDSRRYVFAVIVAALLTAALFALWPAAGPWTVEGFAPNKDQAEVVDALALLKSGNPLPQDTKSAVVAFPSFHVALALLSAFALWNVRGMRWFALTVALLVCVSTITTGWHYGIDVIGGLAVTYVAQWASQRVIRPARRAAALETVPQNSQIEVPA